LRLEIGEGVSQQTQFFEFTPSRGRGNGESLARESHLYRKGDIVLADRGYCTAKGMLAILQAQADYIIRTRMSTMPLAEDGLSAKEANERDDYLWSEFKMVYQMLFTKLNVVAYLEKKLQKQIIENLKKNAQREKRRKRKTSIAKTQWDILKNKIAG